MDVTKLSELELYKAYTQANEELARWQQNMQMVRAEIAKRESKVEKESISPTPTPNPVKK